MVYPSPIGLATGEAAIADAIKASGAIVNVEPGDFEAILDKNRNAAGRHGPKAASSRRSTTT